MCVPFIGRVDELRALRLLISGARCGGAPTAGLITGAPGSGKSRLLLDKTCTEDLSEPLGYICTVQHSDFKWIPAGTDIRYLSQNEAGDIVQARIEIRNAALKGPARRARGLTPSSSSAPGAGG